MKYNDIKKYIGKTVNIKLSTGLENESFYNVTLDSVEVDWGTEQGIDKYEAFFGKMILDIDYIEKLEILD